MRRAEYGERSAESRVRRAEYGERSAESEVRRAECGEQSAESRVRRAERGERSAGVEATSRLGLPHSALRTLLSALRPPPSRQDFATVLPILRGLVARRTSLRPDRPRPQAMMPPDLLDRERAVVQGDLVDPADERAAPGLVVPGHGRQPPQEELAGLVESLGVDRERRRRLPVHEQLHPVAVHLADDVVPAVGDVEVVGVQVVAPARPGRAAVQEPDRGGLVEQRPAVLARSARGGTGGCWCRPARSC